MTADDIEPIIMRVEGWEGQGRGVVIIGWSELDRGPVPALEFQHAELARDGLRDVNGSLVGGLYADDYQRGIEDAQLGRLAPVVTTASYDLGRAKASEDGYAARELLDRLHAESERRAAAVREMLPPEAQADFDRQIEDIRSGGYDARMAWHSISEAQRLVLRIAAKPCCTLIRRAGTSGYDASGAGGVVVPKSATRRTVAALVARRLMEWTGGDDPEAAAEITDRGRMAVSEGEGTGHD